MGEIPVVQGLFLCEQTVVNPRTRNLSFINRFTVLRVDSFPSEPRGLSVFSSLTNGFGQHELVLELKSLQTDESLYRVRRAIRFSDRLQDVPIVLNLSDLIFPFGGAYQFSLFIGDEPLARFRFHVLSRFRSSP